MQQVFFEGYPEYSNSCCMPAPGCVPMALYANMPLGLACVSISDFV